ncbi:hypothetical protein [Lichenifustis flavocetrariae]|uniref:Cysteine rich repeat-containing domain protein n=1 Tax=Lichenifustis flavocetrariae TaxID=2949735 RepID=A0AA41YVN3_9HYPH|nr:hypothetical protein [Lichenifustis flavocetrariae]MCW6507783.1 hypothetical protein [Lichenifustis flavocetrariae]
MQQKFEQACGAEIEKLCAAVKTDADQLKGCMMAKRTQVSPACMKLFDASE